MDKHLLSIIILQQSLCLKNLASLLNKSREVTFKMNFPEGIVWKSKWFRRLKFVWSVKVISALYTEDNFTRNRSPDYP